MWQWLTQCCYSILPNSVVCTNVLLIFSRMTWHIQTQSLSTVFPSIAHCSNSISWVLLNVAVQDSMMLNHLQSDCLYKCFHCTSIKWYQTKINSTTNHPNTILWVKLNVAVTDSMLLFLQPQCRYLYVPHHIWDIEYRTQRSMSLTKQAQICELSQMLQWLTQFCYTKISNAVVCSYNTHTHTHSSNTESSILKQSWSCINHQKKSRTT